MLPLSPQQLGRSKQTLCATIKPPKNSMDRMNQMKSFRLTCSMFPPIYVTCFQFENYSLACCMEQMSPAGHEKNAYAEIEQFKEVLSLQINLATKHNLTDPGLGIGISLSKPLKVEFSKISSIIPIE